jgi:hypothetical protein
MTMEREEHVVEVDVKTPLPPSPATPAAAPSDDAAGSSPPDFAISPATSRRRLLFALALALTLAIGNDAEASLLLALRGAAADVAPLTAALTTTRCTRRSIKLASLLPEPYPEPPADYSASCLDTGGYSGRLGNKLFQNLAVSLLALKYNVRACFSYEAECSQLGLRLASGTRPSNEGANAVLVDESNLEALLFSHSSLGDQRLVLSFTGPKIYYQVPWFAQMLHDKTLPGMSEGLLHANPWHDRIGNNHDTFVHVRLGDREAGNRRRAEDYTAAITAKLPRSPGNEVFIASDSPRHPTVLALALQFNATILEKLGPVETMQFGSTARHIVLSDGTFSWWIGVLADVMSQALGAPAPSIIWLRDEDDWHGDIFVFPEWQCF